MEKAVFVAGCLSLLQIAEGSGRMMVVAVGMNSQFGKLKSMLAKPREETPLQVKLGKVANSSARAVHAS